MIIAFLVAITQVRARMVIATNMILANFSFKGRRSEVFKSKEELNEFIRTCERKLEMEVKYHVPKQVKYSNENTRIKSVEILLDRDSYGYGIVVRGTLSILSFFGEFWA